MSNSATRGVPGSILARASRRGSPGRSFRPSTGWLLGIVAVSAAVLCLVGDAERDRRQRCWAIADNHTRLGAEYRRNGAGDPVRLRIAAWHEDLSRRFVESAARPWAEVPMTRPFPPEGWLEPGEPR